jgi:hypothetical protein
MGALSRDPAALHGLRVGVYGSGGAPWPHAAFAALYGASVRIVRAEDVRTGRLSELDVLIVPGGGRAAMHGLLAPLGADGATAVRAFVEAGGSYLSSCAGSVLPLALEGAADELHPAARELRLTDARMANPGDATLGGLASPGVGVIRVRVDPSSELARGVPEEVELVHYNGPFFDLKGSADARGFAWPVAATDRFTEAERFLPGSDDDAPVFARCVAAGAAAGLVAPWGDGRVILFGSHPEFGLGPLLLGWSDGAQLLLNALASVPRRSGPGPTGPWSPAPSWPEGSAAQLAGEGAATLRRVAAGFDALAGYDEAAWTASGAAPSFLGTAPRDAWRRDRVAASRLATLLADRLGGWAPELRDEDRGWLDDRPRSDQDVGAMGLLQLAAEAEALIASASRAAQDGPAPLAHAYDGLDRHPFHLAVGSYLSAAGLVAGAALQAATLAADRQLALGPLAAWLFDDDDSTTDPEETP